MATPTKYLFSVENDFVNKKVNSDRLKQEILNSSIVISFSHITISGDECEVWFKDILSTEDENILNSIISLHDGSYKPGDYEPAGGIVRQGFYPDFQSFALQDSVKGIQLDSLYNQAIRGAVTTDEGSFRDDFDKDLEHVLTGTVTFTNGSNRISGNGTAFLSELAYYRQVKLEEDDVSCYVEISDVYSDTEAELVEPYSGTSGTGTAVWADWIPIIEGDGSIVQTGTEVWLNSGVENGSRTIIKRAGDYLPMSFGFHAKIGDRIKNQIIRFGALSKDETAFAMFEFDGEDPTLVRLRTSNNGVEIEEVVTRLPGGRTSDKYNYYQVDITLTKVSFYCQEGQLEVHNIHIPAPYQDMNCVAEIINTGDTTAETTLYIDVALMCNYNKLEVKNSTRGEPMPIMVREDTHTVYGVLTSDSTTADQVIVTYEIPEGKTCYVLGYQVDNDGGSAGFVKVGRNDISAEPLAPGDVDCNVCRAFTLRAERFHGEEWGAVPRFVGLGGDVLKIVVTPKTGTNTKWRASLDLILR